ncbi:MAG: protein-disulfide reductase DsbD domain-containing protein [Pseudoruegeria sp.]
MNKFSTAFVSVLAGLSLSSVAIHADVLAVSDTVQAEFLPGWRDSNGTHVAGIKITLAPGWKTYWRAPGDAGIPPQLSLMGSTNIQESVTHWPRPTVSSQNGLQVIGYSDQVVFPLRITPKDASAPIDLTGELQIGVCEDVCIPVTLSLSAKLPTTGQPVPVIKAALNDRAKTAKEAGVMSSKCTIAPIDDGFQITATINMPSAGGSEVGVFEIPDKTVWISETDTKRQGKALTLVADMVPEVGAPFLLDRSDIRISVLGQDHMVDIRGCSRG